jgi:hypothetical protein
VLERTVTTARVLMDLLVSFMFRFLFPGPFSGPLHLGGASVRVLFTAHRLAGSVLASTLFSNCPASRLTRVTIGRPVAMGVSGKGSAVISAGLDGRPFGAGRSAR